MLDRTDETLLHAYWVLARAAGALLPLDEGPSWEVARTSWALDHPEREITFLGAYDGTGRDESLRGGAWVGLPLVDNRAPGPRRADRRPRRRVAPATAPRCCPRWRRWPSAPGARRC